MRSQLLLSFMLLIVSVSFTSVAWAADQYKVIKVESWDTLNMRGAPGTKNSVIAKLPFDAASIVLTGGAKAIGKTNWVEVDWRGTRGWVSKAYLGVQPAASGKTEAVELIDKPDKSEKKAAAAQPVNKTKTTKVGPKKKRGMWILECGNASPYWKVEILPEWMRGTLGKHQTGMPITHKRQKHGKYRNVAVETEVRGANKWNRLRMTLTYNKSCFSKLTKRKVAFSVKGMFNNEPISGCCRSYKVK